MIRIAYVCGRKRIYGLTNEQLDIVKGNLTFLNPQWVQIQKYSRWENTKVNKYVHYYEVGYYPEFYIAVPMGYVLPFGETETIISDDRLSLDVDYPDFELELREIQEQATNEFERLGTLVLPTGCGKAQPLDTKILTPNGYVLMEDIKVGDLIVGEDGNFYPVSGVFPQGEKDVYELTFKDGTSTRCCKEHLWKYCTKNMYKYSKGKEWKVAELQEILKAPLVYDKGYNFNIPVNKPLQYVERDLAIHPYALGLLIGDGCLSQINKEPCNIYFSNTEHDVVDRLNECLGDLGFFAKNSYTQCQYIFKSPSELKKNSRLVAELKRLGLNCLGGEKFIPKDYLFNSVANRMELLKGLFDTDGSVGKNGTYSFSTTSKLLAKDVQWLCRSLGYRTTLRVDDRRGKVRVVNGKEYVTKSVTYSIGILTHDIIFKSEKHKYRNELARSIHRPKQEHNYDKLSVVSVNYVGKLPCQCIMVDSQDHTYLCDDFIVTHNTICGLYLAGKLKQRALIVVNKDDLVDGWAQDAKLCYKDLDIGLVKGKTFKIGEHITLTTIQTLSRLGDKKLDELRSKISMIIVDECHRCGAKSYDVLNSFPTYYRLGLTATKMRNDGLVDVLDHICGKTVFDGTSFVTDVIIPPENIHIIRKNSNVFWKPEKSYYDTRTKATVHNIVFDEIEYIEGTVEWRNLMERLEAEGKVRAYSLRLHKAYELIANNETFNTSVCRDIIENYNKGKSCVVFCKTVEQLNNLYELLKGCCPKIQKFYGNMKDTKAEVKRRAESKEVLITLATISIACEGTNVKAWECGFLVSSVANEKDLIQILGRLRRTTEGKTDVYFYDYRHPQVVGIKKHGYERDNWYKNLKIKS